MPLSLRRKSSVSQVISQLPAWAKAPPLAQRIAMPRQRKRGIQRAEKGTGEISDGRTDALHRNRDQGLHRILATRSEGLLAVKDKLILMRLKYYSDL